MADNHDDLITQFSQLTGVSAELAADYLGATDWDLDAAAAAFYADDDEQPDAQESASSPAAAPAPAPPGYTGPRTLDGRPAPQSASPAAARQARPAPKKKGIATLGSLGGGSGPSAHGHGHAHGLGEDDDDDDDEDYRDDGRGDLFAGGEKSGLAVQDPSSEGGTKKLINDIVKRAKANTGRPETQESAPAPNRFRGAGQTLGGDGVESRIIPGPLADMFPRSQASQEPQSRTLHLWNDGFSIDDGPLHRFNDPQNAADLQLIRQGRAPLHLMNVRYDQPVDVKLEQHDEAWRQLPRIYRPFGGAGRRLGAPTPGEPSAAVTAAPPTTTPATPAAAAAPGAVTVDESQPVVNIRVQLPNGTRLPVRFNTTHSVGDLHHVITLSLADMASRPWVLSTTFPNKDHTDLNQVLGSMPEFRKGGTAVVRWL